MARTRTKRAATEYFGSARLARTGGYQLDNKKKARDYAGQKVTIKGAFDSTTDSIHVTNIQAKVISTFGLP